MADVHHKVRTSDGFAVVTMIRSSAQGRYFPLGGQGVDRRGEKGRAVTDSAIVRRHGLSANELCTPICRIRQQIAVCPADAKAMTRLGSDYLAGACDGSAIEIETVEARIRVGAGLDEGEVARPVSALGRSKRSELRSSVSGPLSRADDQLAC